MVAQVGQSIPRLEARQKVTGRAEYVHKLRLPGLLYGKVFRSTVPHGHIRRIDTGAARRWTASPRSSPSMIFSGSSRIHYGPRFS